MKVIVAGLPHTGAATLVVALKVLGLEVYDFMEHFVHCGNDWMTVCRKGAATKTFQKMYDGVDAVSGLPVWYFWEELLQAFPEAKIILTVEEDGKWLRSLRKEKRKSPDPGIHPMLRCFSPSARSYYGYEKTLETTTFGTLHRSATKLADVNELLLKKVHRQHNNYVMNAAPKNKLLVYNVDHGWAPLCKFLGCKVPSAPFPNKDVYVKNMQSNVVFKRMRREVFVVLSFFTLCLSFGGYALYRHVAPIPFPLLTSASFPVTPSPDSKFGTFLNRCANLIAKVCAPYVDAVIFWH